MGSTPGSELIPKRLDEKAWSLFYKTTPEKDLPELEFKEIEGPDEWFAEAYAILDEEFGPEELDEEQTFRAALELNRKGENPFPVIVVVSFYQKENLAHIVGVVSGNIMPLKNQRKLIYAIGYQVTSKVLRNHGRKGLGSSLLKVSYEVARKWAKRMNGDLLYSVVEASEGIEGYAVKMGYKLIPGLKYWQPPLSFDIHGNPLKKEVKETLMVMPLNAPSDNIDKSLLLDIIRTMYKCWFIENQRLLLKRLDENALQKVESYVMDHCFRRVRELMPSEDLLLLVNKPI
jgi:hypothetical protein